MLSHLSAYDQEREAELEADSLEAISEEIVALKDEACTILLRRRQLINWRKALLNRQHK